MVGQVCSKHDSASRRENSDVTALAYLFTGEVTLYQSSKLILCISGAAILAALAVFLHPHQNPLDGAAAGGSLIRLELSSQAVEEGRFHESLTLCSAKK